MKYRHTVSLLFPQTLDPVAKRTNVVWNKGFQQIQKFGAYTHLRAPLAAKIINWVILLQHVSTFCVDADGRRTTSA